MYSRRFLLAGLAAAPLVAALPAFAQTGPRVGRARTLLLDGRLWIQAHFGAQGPYNFVIDTGTFTNLIRADLARELKMRPTGRVGVQGVGGRGAMPLFRTPSVLLGQVEYGATEFAAYDPQVLRIHPEAAGALSAVLMTVYDSELDFDAGEWRVYPDGRGRPAGYHQLPSQVEPLERGRGAPKIFVDTQIDGRSFRLEVDSGAPGTIALWDHAAARSGLWDDARPFAPMRRRGLGGAGARARLVRAGEVVMGPIRWERPLVSIDAPGESRLGGLRHDGLIGLQLLQQMNVATDLGSKTLWAVRNGRAAPPERYGLSGLWIEERGGTIFADQVSPASPAAEAGVRAGDEIVGMSFRQMLGRLGGRPGDRVGFVVKRDGAETPVTLTLREYL